jgi:hypothetical protein
VDQADAAEAAEDFKEASEKTAFKVPKGMLNDWTGDRFLYERPYGAEALQLNAQSGSTYAYDHAQHERDTEAGYPTDSYRSNKELTETVTDWIDGNGAFRNQFDAQQEAEAKQEKKLVEAS